MTDEQYIRLDAYEVAEQKVLHDISSQGTLLRHKKSGARVMLIENDDENKVFSVGFRTPPSDSTGVAHILEHSVLCGSEKFPLKDPFVELAKGSLNTFLNAMTFPDKTIYPVASCNDKDFQNLMHVYLDAVFFPRIYDRPEIFRQEGWSYQLEDTQEELTYNGVVYNEMKGVFSSLDRVLDREIMNSLFPDTPYGVESGGDPLAIPDLTYEQFLDFHRTYYHPSNSYIYLYGNADMEEKLRFLDEEYLSRFDVLEVASAIPQQTQFAQPEFIEKKYPVLDNEKLEENTYLSYNVVTATSADTKLTLAFQVLEYVLLASPGAPLKQALLDAKIGKDVYGSFEDGICQPYFSIVAKNSDSSRQDEFIQLIRQTLEKIRTEGIDKKALLAGLNYLEFQFREADYASYPKGLMYGMDVLETWLYDEEQAFAALEVLDVFAALREEVQGGYFENLIETYLLANTHVSYLSLVPLRGLAQEQERQTRERLAAFKQSLSQEELAQIAEQTRNLREYQETEETPEDIASIPLLKRSDITAEEAKLICETITLEDTTFLYHDVFSNGISYLSMYFDTRQVPEHLIPYIGILKSVLGYVDTAKYSYIDLFNEINANTGGINCGTESFGSVKSIDEFTGVFGIKAKALDNKNQFVLEMITEILTTSKLSDEKRLYEIVARLTSRLQSALPSAGHSTAVLRALSYDSPLAQYQEATSGIAFYQLLEGLEADFEARKQELIENLQALMTYIFRPENLLVSYTGDRTASAKVQEGIREFKKVLFTAPVTQAEHSFHAQVKNEGFMTSGQVQYVAQAGNFIRDGLSYDGALNILRVILSYDYLWTNIRVKGGAYGCMSGFKRNGEGFFVSYRDPNLKKTFDVFAGIPDYVRDFSGDEREMTKYIIGTISGRDVPKTPKTVGAVATAAYITGLTQEMMQKERDQILTASAEDIRKLAPVVESILKAQRLCVIGSEDMIEKDAALFKEVKHLINAGESDE
ncbi:MAG: insulinase family protein [Lachnospiraceae bacterium]